jgi:hypothetical protein
MHRVFALFILLLTTHSVAHAQEATEPTPPRVIELILRAETEFQNGHTRTAGRTVREASRRHRSSLVARAAHIAVAHSRGPSAVLQLDAAQLQEVVDHHGVSVALHWVGHVLGILGAAAGAYAGFGAYIAIEWARSWGRSTSSDDEVVPVIGALGGGGLLFAILGLTLHGFGEVEDDAVEATLQVNPSVSGASLMFSSRF